MVSTRPSPTVTDQQVSIAISRSPATWVESRSLKRSPRSLSRSRRQASDSESQPGGRRQLHADRRQHLLDRRDPFVDPPADQQLLGRLAPQVERLAGLGPFGRGQEGLGAPRRRGRR